MGHQALERSCRFPVCVRASPRLTHPAVLPCPPSPARSIRFQLLDKLLYHRAVCLARALPAASLTLAAMHNHPPNCADAHCK